MQMKSSVFAMLAAMMLAMTMTGCASSSSSTHLFDDPYEDAIAYGPGNVWIETSLYFGLSSTDGAIIGTEQWNDFLDEVVTPRFPDGLTVLAGRGQFKTTMGKLVKENCKVIVVLHPATDKADKSIEEIRSLYKAKMKQESVLRVTGPVKVSF